MTNMVLECRDGSFEPHPEGVHPAVCVGIMDLGMIEQEYNGERSIKPKLKLTFESEATTKTGKRCTVSKSFTVSLHPKAALTEFLGTWRGRPVLPGENIDLSKLIGASCTLTVIHRQNMVGRTYAFIYAVGLPTRKVTPSGDYDPVAAQERYNDWQARSARSGGSVTTPATPAPAPSTAPSPVMAVEPRPGSGVSPRTNNLPVGTGVSPATMTPTPSYPQPQPVPAPAREAEEDNVPFDPEVGF